MSMICADLLHELVETVRTCPPGVLVEVGVYKGGSAAVLAGVAKEQGRELWLFDTFTGIPYADAAIDFHKKGEFADTSVEEVRAAVPDAYVIAGVFPKSLKEAEKRGLGSIALAHVDCDQYRSVKACCEHLAKHMAPGGVMVFDDYDVLDGARCAVDEVFPGRVEFSQRGKARVRF